MKKPLQHTRIVESEEAWNDLLPDDALVYSTWEWGSICESFGHERCYLGIEEDGELVAGIPLMYGGGWLFDKELVSMPYAHYGEIFVRDDKDSDYYTSQILEDVQRLAKDLGVAQASIRGFGTQVPCEDYETVDQFCTFEVDLRNGADEAWDTVESRFRRSVRKARKEDVEVVRSFDEESFDQYYQMYLDNMRFYGTPPYSRRFFKNVYRLLSERDAFEMYLAYAPDGEPINGVMIFFHGSTAIYWTGVSNYDYRELNGNSLLLWEAIEDSSDRGLATFDLGRTRPDTGVYKYKKSIGKPVDLHDIHFAPDGELTLTDPTADRYEMAKKVWRKLPLRLTEYLGPPVRKRLTM